MKTEAAGFLNIGDDDDEMLIPYPHNTIVHQFEFQDRPGEEVTDLSRQHLIALEGLVDDGIAIGVDHRLTAAGTSRSGKRGCCDEGRDLRASLDGRAGAGGPAPG